MTTATDDDNNKTLDSRRAYMIRNKLPGPYDDTVGPTVLGVMLMISITAQFAIKLMTITKTT
jgi:hypothetical protein